MKYYLYLILLSLVSGCTVGPDYHTPVSRLPSHYSSAQKKAYADKQSRVSQFWYQSFNDPVLINLIQQAINGNNYDIQKSLANIRQARAELNIAKADYYPQLDASGKISRDRISKNSEILSAFPAKLIPLSYTDFNFGFDASWELDFFGHIRRSNEAALARFQSSIENFNNIAIIVAAEVARTYTEYRVYQSRIAIARQTISSYGETVRLVNLKMQAGSASAIDLHRVESELSAAKATLPPLEAEARSTLAALSVLVDEFPESLFKKLNATAPIPTLKPAALSVGLPTELLQHRPDIKIAERQLAAATADLGVAVSNQFPRFQLAGDLGTDTTIAGTYFHKASAFWSIGPNISIPIFEGGRLKNAVKAKEAARNIALATYKQSVLQALADVESSLIRYDRERIANQKLLAAYNKLKSVYKLVNLQYQDGQIALIDVLDVKRQLDQLNDQYVQSVGKTTIDLISLYKAIGGDWKSPASIS